jgi:hypothetical protein
LKIEKAESRRQKAEGRRQKAESRKQKAEGKNFQLSTFNFQLFKVYGKRIKFVLQKNSKYFIFFISL